MWIGIDLFLHFPCELDLLKGLTFAWMEIKPSGITPYGFLVPFLNRRRVLCKMLQVPFNCFLCFLFYEIHCEFFPLIWMVLQYLCAALNNWLFKPFKIILLYSTIIINLKEKNLNPISLSYELYAMMLLKIFLKSS